ncbi:MAG: twin-arginine translocation signal domain-containing protein, partial [Chromatiales bacterium]|nr:twin-arginine translocation signal domain-containing protein [Chromatiales bacterium]
MSKLRRSGAAGLLDMVADKASQLPQPERRDFLKRGLALAGAAAAGPAIAAGESGAEYLPPNVPPWTRSLGRGVVTRPYGSPSDFEANVIRRTVPWLTAS